MSKPMSRGQYLGVQPGVISARSRRLVARAKAALTEISCVWNERDQAVSFDAELLIEQLEKLEGVIAEGVSYLREPMDGFDG